MGGDGEAGDGVVIAVDYYFVAADFADAAFNDFARHGDCRRHCQPIEIGAVWKRGLHGDRQRVRVVFDCHLVMGHVRGRLAANMATRRGDIFHLRRSSVSGSGAKVFPKLFAVAFEGSH